MTDETTIGASQEQENVPLDERQSAIADDRATEKTPASLSPEEAQQRIFKEAMDLLDHVHRTHRLDPFYNFQGCAEMHGESGALESLCQVAVQMGFMPGWTENFDQHNDTQIARGLERNLPRDLNHLALCFLYRAVKNSDPVAACTDLRYAALLLGLAEGERNAPKRTPRRKGGLL